MTRHREAGRSSCELFEQSLYKCYSCVSGPNAGFGVGVWASNLGPQKKGLCASFLGKGCMEVTHMEILGKMWVSIRNPKRAMFLATKGFFMSLSCLPLTHMLSAVFPPCPLLLGTVCDGAGPIELILRSSRNLVYQTRVLGA